MTSNLSFSAEPTLRELQTYVADMMRERGFRDDPDYIPQKFMKLLEECGELAQAARKRVGIKTTATSANSDIEEEAADVLIILVGLCNMLGVDLEKAVRAKEEKNKQRVWK